MSETFDPIDIVREIARRAAEARDTEIATVVFQLAAANVDHAVIHIYEWTEPHDLFSDDFRIITQLAFRPETTESGGYVLAFHPYGQKPDDVE